MSNETKKRSPNLDLRIADGSYVIGTFEGRFESKNYPGKFSTLIKVEETDGSTKLYNKETEKEEEVGIDEGDSVFLSETSWLANIFEKMEKGTRFKLVYTGKTAPTKKGYKGSYTYKLESI
jgi:hypothetical protein